jgi:ribonuclease III
MSESHVDAVEKLQRTIGYQFHDRGTLLQALTHTSFGHENFPKRPIALRDNERLEFLGDAILDVIVSDILLETFPNSNEGQLSKMRAAAVNEKTLAEVSRKVSLQDCVRLGKGEMISGGHQKAAIPSSTFEAMIAAIYLDGGFNAVYPVVRHLFRPILTNERESLIASDYKTHLQELVQARYKLTPTYHLIGSDGPDHAKTFEVEVKMGQQSLAAARGSSKKEAEQNAARAAIPQVSTT